MKSKNRTNERESMVLLIGLLCVLMSILYIRSDIGLFLFFIIASSICFLYSRKLIFKLFSRPIIKRIRMLNNTKTTLLKQIEALEKYKSGILENISANKGSISEINQYKEEINQLELKEKELKKQIAIFENKKSTIEKMTQQEEVIKKNKIEKIIKQEENIRETIKEEKKTSDELKRENKRLESKNIELQEEINALEERINPLRKKIEFIDACKLEYIDELDGFEFEIFVAKLLTCLGYNNSIVTQSSGDYGIDVIAIKDDIKYAIQCKNYSQPVGNKAVQEAYSGKSFYNCHVAIVVTNNYFTNSAKKQAEKNDVVLWDRDKLNEMIETLTKHEVNPNY